jgi:hypothetical protein
MSEQNHVFAMVVDRAHIEAAKEAARGLEKLTLPKGADGWSTGLRLFEGFAESQFLFMLAGDTSRIVNSAPHCSLISTVEQLRTVISAAGESLRGEGRWFMFCEPGITEEMNKILTEPVKQLAPPAVLGAGIRNACRGLH